MNYRKIDISEIPVDLTEAKEALSKIKRDTLYEDAIAREDKEAYLFLEAKHNEKGKKGKSIRVNSYRVEYLERFCGYKPVEKKKPTYRAKSMMDKAAEFFKDK